MRIATWNVNSVKARIEQVTAWLKEAAPDAVCLQELKCEDSSFPLETFERLGYNCAVHGQKAYNGVAILTKRPCEVALKGLPGDNQDIQARYLEAVVPGARGIVRLASIYLPNGNPIGTDKFAYKLAWMERLKRHAAHLLKHEEPLVLAGDYNVIPLPIDAKSPEAWVNDALFQPAARAKFREIVNLGLTDAVRIAHPGPGIYTFWDYQAGAWQRNNGIRIDHCLLSPQAADHFRGVRIDAHVRAWDRPSDHVPVLIELDI